MYRFMCVLWFIVYSRMLKELLGLRVVSWILAFAFGKHRVGIGFFWCLDSALEMMASRPPNSLGSPRAAYGEEGLGFRV